MMQRIINDPDQVVPDYLKGFPKAHPDFVATTGHPRVLKYAKAPVKDKVGIVTGGGSGHKPAFVGYLGKNLVDAVAVGEIFSSPSAAAFLDAFKAADGGKGIACLYGNYSGDKMNVKMAAEDAEDEDITVKTVIANDDVPSAPKGQEADRRGVAGEVIMWKVGGAAAAKGWELDEVIRVAQKAVDNTRSIGIGLTPCVIPSVGKANFSIEAGKMEFGIGHHGEPGIKVTDLTTADEMAEMSLETILPDLPFEKGDEVVVLVSGLGATPLMELYIFYNKVEEILTGEWNMKIHRPYVGEYFTSLDMMGVTLTVMKVDEELKELMDAECYSMGLKQWAL